MDAQRLQVLIVGAGGRDLEAIRHALVEAGVGVDLHVAADADAALRFVRHEDEYADGPLPELVLLDLELEESDPLGFLEGIGGDPALERLIVVALAPDDDDAHLAATAPYRVHEVLRKPLEPDALAPVVAYLNEI